MTQIPNVAEETKEKIKRSSAYSLPHNPTGAGYKPQDIKNTLFKPIVDGQYSVLAEIDKLINELNKVLPSVKISEMKLNGKDNTLQLLDENMQKIASIDLPFVKLTNYEETTKNIPNKIELKLNTTDYSLKAELLSPNGAISQSNEIDLPIESFVVGAEYADGMISLSLENGTTLDVELTDIVRGLVNEKDFESFKMDINGEIGSLQTGILGLREYATENIDNLDEKISKVEQVAKGATRSVAYSSYADMVEIVNIMSANEFKVGDHILIRTMNVPDLWVYSVLPNPFHYSFVDDEAFINELSDIGVTVGHFMLAPLETQKVALTDYVTNDTFNEAVAKIEDEKQDKTNIKSFNNGDTITVKDNTIYTTTDTINNLTILYPTGDFICSFIFTVGDMAQGSITFPTDNSKYIGKSPDFQEGETWEINIMNGYVAAGKVVSE